MSKYQEFCQSFWAGKAKTDQAQLEREDEYRCLPSAVGEVIQRMCAYFQCPPDRAHYLDLETNKVAGTVLNSAPPLRIKPERGRLGLGLEIQLGEQSQRDPYPVWLFIELAPLKRGGFEFYFKSATFQVPLEEADFFNHVAGAINHELQEVYASAPRRIGFFESAETPP